MERCNDGGLTEKVSTVGPAGIGCNGARFFVTIGERVFRARSGKGYSELKRGKLYTRCTHKPGENASRINVKVRARD